MTRYVQYQAAAYIRCNNPEKHLVPVSADELNFNIDTATPTPTHSPKPKIKFAYPSMGYVCNNSYRFVECVSVSCILSLWIAVVV